MDQPFFFSRSFSTQSVPVVRRPRASSDVARPEPVPVADVHHTLRRTSTFAGFYLNSRKTVESPGLSRVGKLHPVPEDGGKGYFEHAEHLSGTPSSVELSYEASSTLEKSETAADEFPEGGLQAWLVVFGSWSAMFASFGILNTIGVFESYLSEHQLANHSASQNGWIFSVFAFILFFGGIEIGHLFDTYGPRALIFLGSCLMMISLLTIGLCTQYWQFFLSFSVVGGLGAALLINPAMGAVSHWFRARRGMAIGIATTAGSVGGIIFPLMLNSLIPKIGFAWGTRIVAFICLFFLIFANTLVKSRLPRHKMERQLPDLTVYKDVNFALTVAGVFFTELALFVPLTYISTYAVSIGISSSLSLQLIAILNAGSVFGRFLPGLISDKYGRFNTMICTISLCIIGCLALWLPEVRSPGMVIAFAVFFGAASGGNIGLVSPVLGQLCDTARLAEYFSAAYAVVSFACLLGIPIAGSILNSSGGDGFRGLILFTSASYALALAFFVIVRVRIVGWKPARVF